MIKLKIKLIKFQMRNYFNLLFNYQVQRINQIASSKLRKQKLLYFMNMV